MGPQNSPAVERGIQMMHMPMNQLPEKALLMAAYMCKQYMMCGEVMLTAYCVYAQIEEGLECDDELYKVDLRAQSDWDEAQKTMMIEHRDGRTFVVQKPEYKVL